MPVVLRGTALELVVPAGSLLFPRATISEPRKTTSLKSPPRATGCGSAHSPTSIPASLPTAIPTWAVPTAAPSSVPAGAIPTAASPAAVPTSVAIPSIGEAVTETRTLVVEAALHVRVFPSVVEAFPLGVDAATAVAPRLHFVVLVHRTSRTRKIGLHTAVSARDQPFVVQRFDNWQALELRDTGSRVRIVRIGSAVEDPTWSFVLLGLAHMLHSRHSATRARCLTGDDRRCERHCHSNTCNRGERVHERDSAKRPSEEGGSARQYRLPFPMLIAATGPQVMLPERNIITGKNRPHLWGAMPTALRGHAEKCRQKHGHSKQWPWHPSLAGCSDYMGGTP